MKKMCAATISATLAFAMLPMMAYANDAVDPQHMPNLDPPVQNPSDKIQVDNLNYFINLSGDVMDSKQDAAGRPVNDFTDALTEEKKVDGDILEEAVNSSDGYELIQGWYDSTLGDTPDDYVAADTEIRKILSENGLLASDDDILAEVKRQIEAGADIRDISGETVSSSLVSAEYFKVYWYVLKEQNDFWHADGILKKLEQPKVQTYTVSYEWTGDIPDGVVLPDTVIYKESDICTVNADYTSDTYITVDGGKYIFSGWDKSGEFTVNSDTVISGVWTFITDEVIPVDPVEPTPEPKPQPDVPEVDPEPETPLDEEEVVVRPLTSSDSYISPKTGDSNGGLIAGVAGIFAAITALFANKKRTNEND